MLSVESPTSSEFAVQRTPHLS